jgi:hypothetical protein
MDMSERWAKKVSWTCQRDDPKRTPGTLKEMGQKGSIDLPEMGPGPSEK